MKSLNHGGLRSRERRVVRVNRVVGWTIMMGVRTSTRLCARLCAIAMVAFASAPVFAAESPMLAELVAKGELPPLEQRLPTPPRTMPLTQPYQTPGKYGGELVLLMGRSKDVRLMVVYGYARLVGYDLEYELVADVLESFEVEEDRRFTFHLRQGHRWSDGRPICFLLSHLYHGNNAFPNCLSKVVTKHKD